MRAEEERIEIVGECLAHQAFDILQDERPRPKFPDGPHRFREHIALIVICLVLAAERERLTGRTTGHNGNIAECAVVEHFDVSFMEGRCWTDF